MNIHSKILCIIITSVFMLSGCDTPTQQDEKVETVNYAIQYDESEYIKNFETKKVDRIKIDSDVGKLTYLESEIIRKNELDILVLYFSYTNRFDDYQCFHDMVSFTAYQDGMEIDGYSLDSEFADNSWREVAKDKHLKCAIAYKITDDKEVTLRACPKINGTFMSSKYQEQIFNFD